MCQRKTYSVLNFTLCILNAWSCFLRSRAFALDTGAVRMRWFLPMDAVCIWDLHCHNWWFSISSFSSSSFSGMVCQNKFSTKTRLLYHHIHSILKHNCNLDEKNTWKRGKTLFVLVSCIISPQQFGCLLHQAPLLNSPQLLSGIQHDMLLKQIK